MIFNIIHILLFQLLTMNCIHSFRQILSNRHNRKSNNIMYYQLSRSVKRISRHRELNIVKPSNGKPYVKKVNEEIVINIDKDKLQQDKLQFPNNYANYNSFNRAPALPPLKVMVFIDGTWLFYSMQIGRGDQDPIYKKFGPNWTQSCRIDWPKIPEVISNNLINQISKLYGYTRYVEIVRNVVFTSTKRDVQEEDTLRSNMINILSQHNFEVNIFKTLHDQEKCVDIALAIEMLYMASVPDAYDIAVLVTGDKDFIPAMQKTRLKAKRVVLCSKRNSCNKDFIVHGTHRDLDVIWLDDYLDILVVPKRLNIEESTTIAPAALPTNSISNTITTPTEQLTYIEKDKVILKHLITFLTEKSDSDGEDVLVSSSRGIGRYLNNVFYNEQFTALHDLKSRYSTLLSFLLKYDFFFDVYLENSLYPEYIVKLRPNAHEIISNITLFKDLYAESKLNFKLDFNSKSIDSIDIYNAKYNKYVKEVMNDTTIDITLKKIVQYIYEALLKHGIIGSSHLLRLLDKKMINSQNLLKIILRKYSTFKSFCLQFNKIFKIINENQNDVIFDLTLAKDEDVLAPTSTNEISSNGSKYLLSSRTTDLEISQIVYNLVDDLNLLSITTTTYNLTKFNDQRMTDLHYNNDITPCDKVILQVLYEILLHVTKIDFQLITKILQIVKVDWKGESISCSKYIHEKYEGFKKFIPMHSYIFKYVRMNNCNEKIPRYIVYFSERNLIEKYNDINVDSIISNQKESLNYLDNLVDEDEENEDENDVETADYDDIVIKSVDNELEQNIIETSQVKDLEGSQKIIDNEIVDSEQEIESEDIEEPKDTKQYRNKQGSVYVNGLENYSKDDIVDQIVDKAVQKPDSLTYSYYSALTVKQLKILAKELKVVQRGSKEELINRLSQHDSR